jgi:transcriptional regulator with XRE-family HTH domain
MASFGDFIKQEREKNGWTQTDFGAKIGINSSAVSRIEHNAKQLSASKLISLSKLFNIDLSRIKVLYFGDKFAREVFKNDCPETVFDVAGEVVKYLKNKNSKQGKINFE